ncbi:MAG TPA: tRNA (adenosine(37)-N6)-threonylcarbamoyltransferase complex ATPase subunit type 1 TsaE [Oscillospiraceae bacterium]|nr:tRNA (adenosine(37)-N6)-threonylcarbamoyltransferase complex ATPase subunit type 1 TsaE [Oscillospiraceae bacterium]HPF57069.1 tRNA (adenosine(37)-N6)-threonylcarbamoyltransferase complex ATPase subunit type 1 TsaE [Clostridiales bacterium]HPK36580.1 tRNA (adenosine(37)-N6)-threonylcarbamoyltransferase complex ATPase subunit type 1 TsaE [Oscillospiraceae bacterium]HPR76802.1 tRNA (adenosine(37)-N6)-threonylcarbamoyltransferase complex ATPase subunit type 1 TsaE [Oscillospiraceae bacterium]
MRGKFVAKNLTETEALAQKLAGELCGGEVVAFFGDLGSGKTTFTSALAAALGCPETVTSPTFVIYNRYTGRLAVNHFDMYRINDFDGLYSTGYFDVAGQPDSVTLIEWSEHIIDLIPEPTMCVYVTPGKTPNERIFEFTEEKKA